MTTRTTIAAGLLLAGITATAQAQRLPEISVAPNQRYLITEDGEPFLYLADTAWELFHLLNREEARRYLQLRADQGYTVIQAVGLAERDGLTWPNAQGDLPLVDKDPTRPAVTPGADPNDAEQYDYWDHVDFIVDEANRLGLRIGFLPSWGRWAGTFGARDEQVLTSQNAGAYGEFLGKRYRDDDIIWVLGGDRPPEGVEDTWRELGKGITRGVAGREDHDAVLMTFHPRGGMTSSTWFHDEPWLDFNMWQTGHSPVERAEPWEKIAADYALTPVKPVVDGEPLYEDHPIGFRGGVREHGFSSDAHIRQRVYWGLFAGAAGVAYGHHSVWQMHAPGRAPVNGPLFFWYEAIYRPGAAQMQHVRTLMESRPMLERVPDQSLVVDPLDGEARIQAIRGDGHLFVYTGAGRAFTVNLGKISGERVTAYWYNPRNGTSTLIGTFDNRGTREFTPQYEGLGSDWVLVLDDASRNYPAPGQLVEAPPPE